MKFTIKIITFLIVVISGLSLLAIPGTINFQGALKDANGIPVNDIQFMEFRIYDDMNAGSLLWSEQNFAVEITDGIFSEVLGDDTTFPSDLFDNPELYLTFFFGGEEMLPRQKILSVPFALQAKNIDGVMLSGLVQQDESGNAEIIGEMTAESFLGNSLTIDNAQSNGIKIEEVAYAGLLIESCESGVVIDSANEGIIIFNVGNPAGTGFFCPDNNGIEIVKTEGNGLAIRHADLNGVEVGSAFTNGFYVNSANDDGFRIEYAGSPSITQNNNESNGLEVNGAEGNGLFVGHADLIGVNVSSASCYGVYANTTDLNHEYGIYTEDKMYSGNGYYPARSGSYGRNTGYDTLEAGDLVCIAGGYEENVLGEEGVPVVKVEKANSRNSSAILGVVEYKVHIRERSDTYEYGKKEIKKNFCHSKGVVMPGDYLAIIVFGPVDVNVDDRSIIKIGEKLTVSDKGYARPINGDDNWKIGILGKALEDSQGKGKIKVYVNCK